MDTDQVERLYQNATSVGRLDRHIGARLRARRVFMQMSENWLASALEISLMDLQGMEAGRVRIGPRRLAFITVALDVADRYFFLGFDPISPEPSDDCSQARDVDRWFRDSISPYENLFLKIARQMVGPAGSARDLVHDAYAQVMINDRWRTIDNPKAYVKTAIVNLARNLLHRQRIVPMVQLDRVPVDQIVDLAPDIAHAIVMRDRFHRVMTALDKLPPQVRRVMLMRRIEDLSAREIAKRLGLSFKTVEGYLATGMVLLNKHLEADANRHGNSDGRTASGSTKAGTSTAD